MRAYVLNRYGGPESAEIQQMPVPTPGPDDLLVDVRTAGINPLDFKTRQGKLKVIRNFRFPQILGNELAGVVRSTGQNVTRFSPGDEIFARLDKDRLGAFAQVAVVKDSNAAKKPKSLNMAQAASIPLVALTAWQCLFDVGGVQEGSRILIQAGAGGVGSLAIQLAKSSGAWVASTCSSRNIDYLQSLGVDHVIDYAKENFWEQLSDLDLVLDTLGGDAINKSFQIVKKGGLIISISGVPEPQTARDEGLGFLKQYLFWLVSVRQRLLAAKTGTSYRYVFMRPDGIVLEKISGYFDSGQLKPIEYKTFPLESAREAIAQVESGHSRGKVVLTMD